MRKLLTIISTVLILFTTQFFSITVIAQTTVIEAYQNSVRANDFTAFCHDYPEHLKCVAIRYAKKFAYEDAVRANNFTAFCRDYPQHRKCVEIRHAYQDAFRKHDFAAFCRGYPQHRKCLEISYAYQNAIRKNDFTAFCRDYPQNLTCVEIKIQKEGFYSLVIFITLLFIFFFGIVIYWVMCSKGKKRGEIKENELYKNPKFVREVQQAPKKISRRLYIRSNFLRIPVGYHKREPEYRQIEFDSKLRQMIQEACSKGQQFCTIVSKHLHDRVVKESQTNRMPMACNAMWKLWEKQGSHMCRIISDTPSGQSSTIRIRFETFLNEEDKTKFPQSDEQEEFDSELRRMLQEARSKGKHSCAVISKHLHDRVVKETQTNRMPMARNAMWKLWEEQGSRESRIFKPRTIAQSLSITIVFDTGLTKEDKTQTQKSHQDRIIDTTPSQHIKKEFHTGLTKKDKIWRTQADNEVLDVGLDANFYNFYGWTALHVALKNEEKKERLQTLLDAGVDVNARDWQGKTPLHIALRNQVRYEEVQVLLDAGADVNALDWHGNTPLDEYGRHLEQGKVIDVLLQRGAKRSKS